MDSKANPGALSPNRYSTLEDALEHFEADLNPSDPVHRQAAQLANLCVQVCGEYAALMTEAHKHLAPHHRDHIIPAHQNRGLEALSRLREILSIEA